LRGKELNGFWGILVVLVVLALEVLVEFDSIWGISKFMGFLEFLSFKNLLILRFCMFLYLQLKDYSLNDMINCLEIRFSNLCDF